MSGFEVTSVDLLATGGQVRAVADEVRAEVAVLAAVIDGTCDGSWRGRAASSFAAAWAEWRAGARQVLDGLDAMGSLLTSTGHDYEAAEAASTVRSVA